MDDDGTCIGCELENSNSNKYCDGCIRWNGNEDSYDNYTRKDGYLNAFSICSFNR